MITFFKKFIRNTATCFSPKYLPWHLLAIALTYFIVSSDFDWYYFVHIQNMDLRSELFPAILLGGILPIIIPLFLIIMGIIKKDRESKFVGAALAQAVLIGSFISSFYKAFTGRIQPQFSNTLVDTSHQFNFGFWEHGIFWGWPSSHTTIAFAMGLTLFMLYPKHKYTRYIAVIYALYIGVGVTVGIHWFSEFIAGAIFGSIIGIVVGKSYLKSLKSIDTTHS